MRNHLFIRIFCALALCSAVLAGVFSRCLLAQESAAAGNDSLAGVFVTLESLPDDAPLYGTPIWFGGSEAAALLDGLDFGMPGYLLMNWYGTNDAAEVIHTFVSDEDFDDLHLTSSITDEGEASALEATLYFALNGLPARSGTPMIAVFYLNPVYRTQDERYYALPGQCLRFDTDAPGTSGSLSLSDTYTETINGESKAQTARFSVTMSARYAAETVAFLQLDRDLNLVRRDEYDAAALPDTLPFEPAAETLLVQSLCSGPDGPTQIALDSYTRTDFTAADPSRPEAESLLHIMVCTLGENGVCHTPSVVFLAE